MCEDGGLRASTWFAWITDPSRAYFALYLASQALLVTRHGPLAYLLIIAMVSAAPPFLEHAGGRASRYDSVAGSLGVLLAFAVTLTLAWECWNKGCFVADVATDVRSVLALFCVVGMSLPVLAMARRGSSEKHPCRNHASVPLRRRVLWGVIAGFVCAALLGAIQFCWGIERAADKGDSLLARGFLLIVPTATEWRCDDDRPILWPYLERPEVMDVFLKHGVDPDERMSNGETMLFSAVRRGRPDVVEVLLRNGADPRLANRRGTTAIDLAESLGLPELAERMRSSRLSN